MVVGGDGSHEFCRVCSLFEGSTNPNWIVLFLFFGFARGLTKTGIITPLRGRGNERVLIRILTLGFVLALAIILLGFGLKYKELSEEEQDRAISAIRSELYANYEVLKELGQNTSSILSATQRVNDAIRRPGIEILVQLFPEENLALSDGIPPSLAMAREGLRNAQSLGLFDNELEREKVDQAANVIAGIIERTRIIVNSMSDKEETRYLILNDAWKANSAVVRRINKKDMSELQLVYSKFQLARSEYGVLITYCLQYLDDVQELLDHENGAINETRLAKVLASERLYIQVASTYGEALANNLEFLDDEIRQYIGSSVKT